MCRLPNITIEKEAWKCTRKLMGRRIHVHTGADCISVKCYSKGTMAVQSYLFFHWSTDAMVQCTNGIDYNVQKYTLLAEASAEAQTCTSIRCAACRNGGWNVAWLQERYYDCNATDTAIGHQ